MRSDFQDDRVFMLFIYTNSPKSLEKNFKTPLFNANKLIYNKGIERNINIALVVSLVFFLGALFLYLK